MAIIEMFFWWYASGWAVFAQKTKSFLSNIIDFFSMNSLIRTLFKPFRQISAETANENASLDLKFHMFIDRLISRFIGFATRLVLLVAGLFLILVGGTISLVLIIIWPLVPLMPIIGLVLTIMGVTL
ncbi:hypothetical protein J6S37_02130 [Candidatus Saccharibacteria bacterium]|nr:hypothetical protein [Candidatus Saccharibacteria bacterium]